MRSGHSSTPPSNTDPRPLRLDPHAVYHYLAALRRLLDGR